MAVCCSSASVRSRLRALELGEQAHVLDGDDGLVGEGPQQLDLLLGKRARHVAVHGDGADRLAFAQHRDGQDAAEAGRLGYVVIAVSGSRRTSGM